MAKRVVGTEEYLTSRETAAHCVMRVDEIFGIDSFSAIIEPSAGDGVFLEFLPSHKTFALDVQPQSPNILRADFFTWLGDLDLPKGRLLTIGNPPFGQRGALAIRFFERAAQFSDVIAFILPQSFNKYTFQNRVPLDFHLVDSHNFRAEFRTPTGLVSVNSVFQVWERGELPRLKSCPPTEHEDFLMKHAHLSRIDASQLASLRRESDFAIPQVGKDFSPRDVQVVTRGSYWFIRCRHPEVRSVFETLDFSFLENMNVAHMSLSKADIVHAYTVAKAMVAATQPQPLDEA